jgi:hypothetical protein
MLANIAILFLAILWQQEQIRPVVERMKCADRIRQLVWAMHPYHDDHGTLPPAILYDERGRPMQGWRLLILPCISEGEAFRNCHFNEPWNSPNDPAVAESLDYRAAICPGLLVRGWLGFRNMPKTRYTSYVAITGPGTGFSGPDGTSLDDVADGTSSTLVRVESAASDIQLPEPRDLMAEPFLDASERGFGQGFLGVFAEPEVARKYRNALYHHAAGINFGLIDGCVRCVSRSSDLKTIRQVPEMAVGGVPIDF